ncbi:alcohol dehydrogenase 2-like [Lingula anatina]|uniref:Alcohol dehydrogenase 2-like n=1 Tax=Lingula anatina TaxID=7574 RepID=A0A1S3H5W4_LINAN|nr:alcohol dehydrogenase 2-like [Lingula anatina]|eukprot:XP_013380866.1 alcohol dehydrogenase 2-like [Lingula anatina]
MKRAVVFESSKPLRLTDYAIPTPPSNGAVVKITYSGVCHSDIHFWEGFDNLPGLKELAPGHEIAGVVEALGDDAGTELNVGDNVVVYPWLACLECALCVGWRSNLCRDIRQMLGFRQHGGFATHVVVPIVERTVLRIPRGLSPEVACMLPCSGITTYNAVLNTRDTLQDMVGLKVYCKDITDN